LEEDGAAAFGDAGFDVTALEVAGLDRAATALLVGRFAVREDVRAVFAVFDLRLLVAIWLSLV
jgi:hypothetical protein